MKQLYIRFILICIAYGQDDYFSNHRAEDGLSYNTITSFPKDRKEFVWFVSKDGLNHLDTTTRATQGVYGFVNRSNVIKTPDMANKLYGNQDQLIIMRADNYDFSNLQTFILEYLFFMKPT